MSTERYASNWKIRNEEDLNKHRRVIDSPSHTDAMQVGSVISVFIARETITSEPCITIMYHDTKRAVTGFPSATVWCTYKVELRRHDNGQDWFHLFAGPDIGPDLAGLELNEFGACWVCHACWWDITKFHLSTGHSR